MENNLIASAKMSDREKYIANRMKKYIKKYGSDAAKQGTDRNNRPYNDGTLGAESRLEIEANHKYGAA